MSQEKNWTNLAATIEMLDLFTVQQLEILKDRVDAQIWAKKEVTTGLPPTNSHFWRSQNATRRT